MHILNSI